MCRNADIVIGHIISDCEKMNVYQYSIVDHTYHARQQQKDWAHRLGGGIQVRGNYLLQLADCVSFYLSCKENIKKFALVVPRPECGIQIRTMSYNSTHQETGSMEAIHRYIQKAFPKIHTTDFITRHVINQKSLVYRVKGSRFGHYLNVLSIGKIHDPHSKMKA